MPYSSLGPILTVHEASGMLFSLSYSNVLQASVAVMA